MSLIVKAQSGDAQALERMVLSNLGLVRSVCARFMGRGCEKDELYQLGCVGLVKAVKNFKVEMNVRFSTYAVPMIMGEVRRFLRDDGSMSVGRRLKETAAKALKQADALRQVLGREPTFDEIAAALGIAQEDLAVALESSGMVMSLDAPLSLEDGGALGDVVGTNQRELDDDRLMLKTELEQLEPKDRQLILLRYFKDMTQAQTARMLGMTQVQVSRQEARILKYMKGKMQA